MTRLCRNVEKLIINIPRFILTTTVTIYKAEHAYQHNTIMNRRILSKRWGKEGKRHNPLKFSSKSTASNSNDLQSITKGGWRAI